MRISHVICQGDTLPPKSTQQDMTATETFATLRRFLLKHSDAIIVDQGAEFGADFQQLCLSRGILPVVTDLETPWQNAVVERHGPVQDGVRESSSLEAPDARGRFPLIPYMIAQDATHEMRRSEALRMAAAHFSGSSLPPTAER